MKEAYGALTPVPRTIYARFELCRAGDFSLEDKPRSGRPPNWDHIEAIRSAVEDSKISSVRQVSDATGVPIATAHSILRERLGLKKIMARWVPHDLTPDQKNTRVVMCREMLETLGSLNRRGFLNIFTADESWFKLAYSNPGQ